MGTMTFQLPAGLPADSARELERTCVAGGSDNMPWYTVVRVEGGRLAAVRGVDESGYVVVPWDVDGAGRLMGATATLMERPAPYDLVVELARGKVNQVRCQAAEWRGNGLQVDAGLERQIRDATHAFVGAVAGTDAGPAGQRAGKALALGYHAADALVRAYVDQVFHIRHQRQARLDTPLGCRLGPAPPPGRLGSELLAACNAVCVPMAWGTVEGEEGSYDWGAADALVGWAEAHGAAASAGPLIDFSPAHLPAWLWLWEGDVPGLASFACKYVEAAVRRYRTRVRRWQLTAASNCASVLSLGEDELLGLTYRRVETARQVDPSLELAVGGSQPWGEDTAAADRQHSPFVFADTLVRSGLNLSALDLELVMGVAPRGSYCRDLLEASRLLELYALLGVPLRVTLGYPSASSPDPDADPELRVDGGRWRGGFDPATQAEWAGAFGALALCKPSVQGVQWAQLSDAGPHPFPHCGLADASGRPKPALARLRALREQHLR